MNFSIASYKKNCVYSTDLSTHQVCPEASVQLAESGRRELGELLKDRGADRRPGRVVQRLDEVGVEGGGPLRAVRVVDLETLSAT